VTAIRQTCPRCAVTKNSSEFTRVDGERDLSRCRSCKTLERQAAHYEQPQRKQSSYVCTACNVEKHYRAFVKGETECRLCKAGGATNNRGVWRPGPMHPALRRFICGGVA
jgi:uncharacterized protein (DUF983 family)